MTVTLLPPVTGFLQERDLETEKHTEKRRPCDEGGRDGHNAVYKPRSDGVYTLRNTCRIAGRPPAAGRRPHPEERLKHCWQPPEATKEARKTSFPGAFRGGVALPTP